MVLPTCSHNSCHPKYLPSMFHRWHTSYKAWIDHYGAMPLGRTHSGQIHKCHFDDTLPTNVYMQVSNWKYILFELQMVVYVSKHLMFYLHLYITSYTMTSSFRIFFETCQMMFHVLRAAHEIANMHIWQKEIVNLEAFGYVCMYRWGSAYSRSNTGHSYYA